MYSLSYTCSGAETYSLYVPGKACSMSKSHLIHPSKARRYLDKGLISSVIDVRSDVEWSQGHYIDAKHIPFNTVSETSLRKQNVKKDDCILIYCNTGHRARYAGDFLKSIGFKNVFYITSNYTTLNTTPCQTSSSERYALPQAPVATA